MNNCWTSRTFRRTLDEGGALALAVGTFEALGVDVGDVVGLRLGEAGLVVQPVTTAATSPAGAGWPRCSVRSRSRCCRSRLPYAVRAPARTTTAPCRGSPTSLGPRHLRPLADLRLVGVHAVETLVVGPQLFQMLVVRRGRPVAPIRLRRRATWRCRAQPCVVLRGRPPAYRSANRSGGMWLKSMARITAFLASCSAQMVCVSRGPGGIGAWHSFRRSSFARWRCVCCR